MTVVSFVISGLLVGVMVGISWYGARTLPPDARIPLHRGPGGYGNFASRNTALVVYPLTGAGIFALLAGVSQGVIKPNHASPGVAVIILPVVLAVIAATQWGAISRARSGTTDRSDQ